MYNDKIKNIIIEFYIDSKDFNGIPFQKLLNILDIETELFQLSLKELYTDNLIDIVSSNYVANPHIKQFSNLNRVRLLEEFDEIEKLKACYFYPSVYLMSNIENNIFKQYNKKPYSKNLAQGYGQLDFQSFDISILEFYRNDPRYYYQCNDIQGSIYIQSEHEENFSFESGKIYLQSFSFSYSKEHNQRCVAVFNKYLSDLSEEHQLVWKHKEIKNDFKLHPVYIQHSIMGEFSDYISLTDAFLEEMKIINAMSVLMKKPNFFKKTYNNDEIPEFSFLLKPTLKEYNDFIHLLDKLMSENLNKDFFENDILLEYDEIRSDNKIEVKRKGTVQLLNEWLNKYFTSEKQGHIKDIIPIIKKIRKLRQSPAHSIKQNIFDNKYYKEQRELLNKDYIGIRTIRLIFANHPNVKLNPPKIYDSIFKGKILDY
jgi:hypothetical protein